MKKMLFFGHLYHWHTRSSRFIIELFRDYYDIDEMTVDSNLRINVAPESDPDCDYSKEYDVLILWQVRLDIGLLRSVFKFRHIAFFPMYDATISMTDSDWLMFKDATIVSFCATLHNRLRLKHLKSHYIQYYPKALDITDWGQEDRAFFWQRSEYVTVDTIAPLMEGLNIHKLHLHVASDPGREIEAPKEAVWKRFDITTSEWFASQADMLNVMKNTAYYFAPRIFEGIGMSFLEAMAMGRCVVSPDSPTMNEYIRDGENGLLYAYDEQRPLAKVNSLQNIQKRAHASIVEGHAAWERNKSIILEWIS